MLDMTPSNPTSPLSRRQALKRTFVGSLVAGGFTAFEKTEANAPPLAHEPAPFVPENDYPYFGFEPESPPSTD